MHHVYLLRKIGEGSFIVSLDPSGIVVVRHLAQSDGRLFESREAVYATVQVCLHKVEVALVIRGDLLRDLSH